MGLCTCDEKDTTNELNHILAFRNTRLQHIRNARYYYTTNYLLNTINLRMDDNLQSSDMLCRINIGTLSGKQYLRIRRWWVVGISTINFGDVQKITTRFIDVAVQRPFKTSLIWCTGIRT